MRVALISAITLVLGVGASIYLSVTTAQDAFLDVSRQHLSTNIAMLQDALAAAWRDNESAPAPAAYADDEKSVAWPYRHFGHAGRVDRRETLPDFVRLHFANGCVAGLTASRVNPSPRRVMQVWGAEGYARLDLGRRRLTLVQPSAELREGQLDEDSLGSYDALYPVLEGYIEDDRTLEELSADGFDPGVVARAVALIDRAEYKRRQAPPGVKLRPKAFGRDRRTPITNRWPG